MIMQTRKHCLRPPWKTAPPSTSRRSFATLEAGEQITFHEGRRRRRLARLLDRGSAPVHRPGQLYRLVTNAQGETFSVPLTPRYTTPDGGSFSLAPEREEVLP
ncbi:MAG: hypothetical protein ACLUJG_12490 [Lawsonibacter sp.]